MQKERTEEEGRKLEKKEGESETVSLSFCSTEKIKIDRRL